ncbi:MAG: flagellar biosynthetic protein FliP [Planctomycetaceae bacterium]|nr:flagellar biosynthetic protein FliP [Planctomycetaceae bacterium]
MVKLHYLWQFRSSLQARYLKSQRSYRTRIACGGHSLTARLARRIAIATLGVLTLLSTPLVGTSQEPGSSLANEILETTSADTGLDLKNWTDPENFQSSLRVFLSVTVLSLAPGILLMCTSFVRIAVVLGLLRQALGAQQFPSNQVVTSLALFMTLAIMSPVWKRVYEDAIVPYTDPHTPLSWEEAWQRGAEPVRDFMSRQIDAAGNHEDVHLFCQYLPAENAEPQTFADVPLQALLPAFMLSELKTAFLIGFQVYLPFLVLDIVVASVTVSMGMLMLPPVIVSLPFKILLFVLVDGWHLVVQMLLESFVPL